MPVNPYSVLIHSGSLAAGASSPLIEPPAGYIYVVTDISAGQGYSSTAWFQVAESQSGALLVFFESLQSTIYQHWSGRQVVPEGMTIQATANGIGANYRINGYQLQVVS